MNIRTELWRRGFRPGKNWRRLALQDPQDYLEGLIITVRNVMAQQKAFPEEVVGIGVDFTSSTVLPVKAEKTPLCHLEKFKDEPHAYVKLWKHHGAEEEALQIDKIAKERGEEWLSLYGGKVSSEWMIPKVLETLHHCAGSVQGSGPHDGGA